MNKIYNATMNLPNVELLHNTPIEIADTAIGTCWDIQKDEPDFNRMDRVANKYKHESTIEHISYNFYIKNISRALMQELARHRIASISAKSTRYTLKELKKEEPFIFKDEYGNEVYDFKRANYYIKLTNENIVNQYSVQALDNLRKLVASGISNDVAKYALPECYKIEITYTVNARALKNLVSLRLNKSALEEFRELIIAILSRLPKDHLFLYKREAETTLKKDDNMQWVLDMFE